MTNRPNVLLILCDDLGYSDIGCYGGEIRTPSLDRLASDGVRLTQFYNTARCSPSRASLLTGLHPHQTGVGILTNDDRPVGYKGDLDPDCITVAEILGSVGYETALFGKWHLSNDMRNPSPSWPTRRGFKHFYGTITGCGSYYWPGTLTRGEQNAEHEALGRDFYYTDAITDETERFLLSRGAQTEDRAPFFAYVAYTAPHWPLHAPEEDIARYKGRYAGGWDTLRLERHSRQLEMGLLSEEASLSDRDPTQQSWDEVDDKEWQQRRMEVYAAQVDRMDQGIGRLFAALESTGEFDNTLIIFLSDNGASPEALPKGDPGGFRTRSDILRTTTRDGRPVRIGNDPAVPPGPEETYSSYGRAWANLSNTPFRYYKRWVHEGGIAAPMIIRSPQGGTAAGSIVQHPFQLTDVLPTILDVCGIEHPTLHNGAAVPRPEGETMLPALRGNSVPDKPLFWEHTGNAAVRSGRWKLVREHPADWELYDLSVDRSETHNLAAQRPCLVAELAGLYNDWATRVGVIPWERILRTYGERGLGDEEAAG